MRKVQIERKTRVFDSFFKIDEAILRYERFDGQMSRAVQRLNLDRGDAVAALVMNRETQRVVLVNQFRYPTLEKGPGWVTEILAGILEVNEEPQMAIRREILEEIGYDASNVRHIATFYVSPGGSSERIFLYYVEVEGTDKIASGGGVASEEEDIKILEFSLPELWTALEAGEFTDAKTIIALMWLRNRMEEQ